MYKRIIAVLGANIFGQICTILIQFLGVPIFLKFWGKEIYGEWLMIIAIPSYLMVTGSGVGFVSGNKLQMLVSNKREQEAAMVFQSAWTLILFLCLGLLAITTPVIYLAPINEWLNIKFNPSYEVKATLITFCIYMFFSLWTELLTGVYRASNRFARGIFIMNMLRLLEFAGIVAGLYFGATIFVAAIVYLAIRILGVIWMLFECAKLPWFFISFSRASFKEIKSEFKAMVSFLGVPMSQALLIQGMTTIIGIRLGPAAVVVFSVTRTLVNVIKQFASIIYSAILPEFSSSISTGNLKTARSIHRFSFQTTFWFVLVGSTLLYFLSDWIMFIWTGGKVHLENPFFLLMLVVNIPYALSTVSSFVPASINKFSVIAVTSVSNALMCTITTYLLAPYFGLLTVPMTLFVAEIIMFYVVVKQSLRILEDPFMEFAYNCFTLPLKKLLRF